MSRYRSNTNKRKSAGQFTKNVSRTHPANVRTKPNRGGIRL